MMAAAAAAVAVWPDSEGRDRQWSRFTCKLDTDSLSVPSHWLLRPSGYRDTGSLSLSLSRGRGCFRGRLTL